MLPGVAPSRHGRRHHSLSSSAAPPSTMENPSPHIARPIRFMPSNPGTTKVDMAQARFCVRPAAVTRHYRPAAFWIASFPDNVRAICARRDWSPVTRASCRSARPAAQIVHGHAWRALRSRPSSSPLQHLVRSRQRLCQCSIIPTPTADASGRYGMQLPTRSPAESETETSKDRLRLHNVGLATASLCIDKGCWFQNQLPHSCSICLTHTFPIITIHSSLSGIRFSRAERSAEDVGL